jgi:hypothetical protein
LPKIELDGPTHFSEVIEKMITIAKDKLHSNTYHILLIITDGEIHDMQKTVNAIIEASGLPISIIIIGVGDEEFINMKKLDSDKSIIRN